MIIYGKQLFLHILDRHKEKLETIYLAKECDKQTFRKIASSGVRIERVDNKKAQAMARGGNHQGFLAKVKDFEFASIDGLKNKNFLVILYGLSDVGNIGAITRTAYALGADGIVIVSNSLSIEGIIRASSGAAYEIPICTIKNGLDLINELKQVGFSIYGSAKGGKSVQEVKFSSKKALIMGSEGEGIPNKVLQKCDDCLGIKMNNDWDSLNVSAAFAIICDRIING
ncbi:rRNA methyltransferase, TrmH family, group 3 [Campylobacter blaseri]|uniref:23S rRNA (Guanosine(2251)-2'-O)-methyltransferase RlmB n=1 Tax=Campylobacter blaseri TaxID=2042961 RepID=A0A2P8R123_9BACT|nr:23S rRNA (guanosine(2251)-2'-O)-methyltransferase RlmB [Campylobacter blaseri]PSM52181.1 23S rRNA (guanosine(2251)-2'-O)-methyltransferase RlmB [Campylobacter blaseri]PSM53947.1 23S rRNA (guanosine(2251)-2'-O)-methyltransferase RlmB [Campylobacter blaseri]QKF85384.1 rRNA methyltransferase, TrmH family, group 3 [Campylobacter blaseri]